MRASQSRPDASRPDASPPGRRRTALTPEAEPDLPDMSVDDVEVALPDAAGAEALTVTPEDVLAVVREVLDDDKAEDVTVIELRGRTSLADYMVVCSGRSVRQMTTIAQHLRERLNRLGLRHLGVEGRGSADWVLVDAGDVIVQVFRPEARAFYGLEKMWSEALLGRAPEAAGPRALADGAGEIPQGGPGADGPAGDGAGADESGDESGDDEVGEDAAER